ncbi:fluoride efflux transporter CrcB [Rhizobium sp. CRIBSB]|uniref:Fluoride-specific ion channel FluC n=1 Tax=Peteryoungia aggregata LMG 23059 TaxID=1368425 RepID=A0ABU0G6V0_9HYPH|nr:fluoride efflux transporter CrcB [Peteryoungia aggregata]MDQ0421064.1 CrcB protein [Peteryoungia aggregata LMG 23059]NBB47336.1 fluoride efflux transporter CrcB [Rhizobium sp. CRIBSB]
MFHILLVAVGGATGSVARYLTGIAMTRLLGPAFPWGTITVNIVGSFAIGLLAELVARKLSAPVELRLLLVVGFLGGFTTFSSFSLDTLSLFEKGEGLMAFVYVGASVLLSLAAAFGGLALGRSLF